MLNFPIFAICNNIGEIFMDGNLSPGVRMLRTVTRYHFVNVHVKVGLIFKKLQTGMILICKKV
jgi:hypothetical protein